MSHSTDPASVPAVETDAAAVTTPAAAEPLPVAADDPAAAAPGRKRPKPGERRIQILQTLASMLEQPGAERVTTGALAAMLDVSEAALYRHCASDS